MALLFDRIGLRRTLLELVIALAGATLVLTAGDQFHVQYGVIRYANPGGLFGQAWWVAPGFALATVGLVGVAFPLTRRADPVGVLAIVRDVGWFFAGYASSGIFGHWGVGLALVYVGLCGLRLALHRDRRSLLVLTLILAVLGTLGEIALHATGVCSYTRRDLLLVPIWVPCLYMLGAPAAFSLARWCRGPS